MRLPLSTGLGLAAAVCCIENVSTDAKPTFQPRLVSIPQSTQLESMNTIIELRGGARKKKGGRTATLYSNKDKTVTGKQKVKGSRKEEKKKSAVSDTFTNKYKSMLPLTRTYITMVGVVTLLGLVLGEELAQGLLALDPIRVIYGLELWRPFTAACFLGPPSIGWLMNSYYLFQYGSDLERGFGTSQHFLFLLIQIGLLSVLSAFFGQPFFAQSVITSMLHVLSRAMPTHNVKWLVFTVPYWTLPYGLMASDVLQAKDIAAALPHILGILSGHVYFFSKNVWPKLEGGEDWLVAPEFLRSRLDKESYVDTKKSINNALKSRKKGKGRKLGSI